jgi:hypothetical protein
MVGCGVQVVDNLIIQAIAFPGYILSILFIDRIGRKRLQMGGFLAVSKHRAISQHNFIPSHHLLPVRAWSPSTSLLSSPSEPSYPNLHST